MKRLDIRRRTASAGLLLGLVGVLLLAEPIAARAGAFELREQSARGLGEAFAGVAAGTGGLSSMFWNPATMTELPGWQASGMASVIVPRADLTTQAGTSPYLLPLGSAGEMAPAGVLPALYGSFQVNDRLWFGMAFNTPYGLASDPTVPSASEVYGMKSTLRSAQLSPSFAYKINEFVSVGGGVRLIYLDLNESTAQAPLPTPPVATLKGNAWGVGITLGATLKPLPGTEIGIGYRSRASENVHGSLNLGAPLGPIPAGSYGTSLGLSVPDTVSLGARQLITDRFTLAATVEWTNWSMLKGVPIDGSPIPGQSAPFFYRNGWMFSVGGDYRWNPNLTLRAGIGYELSPITTAIREIRDPDRDRKWGAIGLTWQVADKLSLDLGYAHYLSGDAAIAIVPGNPTFAQVGLPYVGNVKGGLDVVAFGINYRWD